MAQWMERQGLEPPIEEPEPVFPDLLPIWCAWHELSISRPAGFMAGGIPWLEMSRYCEDHGIDGALRLRWIRLLRAMDVCYLNSTAEERAKRKREDLSHGDAGSRA